MFSILTINAQKGIEAIPKPIPLSPKLACTITDGLQYNLNLSAKAKGTYLVLIKNEKQSIAKKIIIK